MNVDLLFTDIFVLSALCRNDDDNDPEKNGVLEKLTSKYKRDTTLVVLALHFPFQTILWTTTRVSILLSCVS